MDPHYDKLKKDIEKITVVLKRIHVEVPEKIAKEMEKIGELDKRTSEKMAEIEATKVEFIQFYSEMSDADKTSACSYIEKELEIAESWSTKKVEIAKSVLETLENVKVQFQEGVKNFPERYNEPEEQVWCYCREEKPDEMFIFCEIPECPIQWFHFKCVGIAVAPEGDWFCKECLAKVVVGGEPSASLEQPEMSNDDVKKTTVKESQ
ncbi:hypothetical protein CRE_10605 [Caenorhabditis remanei]|uniref:Inhibitor of growth protein n=1 Tax=Caenorhabditis remanei TaxID=31234 RepID=E3NBM3_CAERE|nr:hypothetical protein CRE_10605 [Caenorhabditis remanei]